MSSVLQNVSSKRCQSKKAHTGAGCGDPKCPEGQAFKEAYSTAVSTGDFTLYNQLRELETERNKKKSFFDFFKGTPKKKELGSLKTVSPTKIVERDPELNELLVASDGRYRTRGRGYGDGPAFVYAFGDLTKDPEAVKALHEADINKLYQNGDCGVLANELWNTNKHVEEYYIFKTEDEPEFGLHQFVKLHDGTYADSLGIWTHEEMLATWKVVDPKGEISILVDVEPSDEPIAKYPEVKISNPQLFSAITDVIEKHMSGKNS